METDIDGRCHCGAVRYRLTVLEDDTTICNCSICRRYGTIWAYGWLGRTIDIAAAPGARTAYSFGDASIAFHRCTTCGCVTDWTSLSPGADGPDRDRTRCAVNLRLADPAVVAEIALNRFDGATTFGDLPPDGRCIRDMVV